MLPITVLKKYSNAVFHCTVVGLLPNSEYVFFADKHFLFDSYLFCLGVFGVKRDLLSLKILTLVV